MSSNNYIWHKPENLKKGYMFVANKTYETITVVYYDGDCFTPRRV